MFSISVAEMLKLYGKWIRAKDFEEFVSVRRKVTVRQAHNLIKKAVTSQEILRVPLANGTVLYGLAEFGPTEPGPLVEGKRINNQSRKQYSFPIVPFEVTQRIRDRERDCYLPPNFQRPFPSVGFNMWNCNDYPVRVRVRVRMILGGRDKGLIPDPKGYYNGETEMPFGPKPDGLVNGNFSVTEECEKSGEDLTLQVSVIAIDPDNIGHRLSPKSWTYMRKENSWFYEPRVFVEEQWPNLRLG
jgi:hypothetical protein